MIDRIRYSILIITIRLFICYASTELVEEWGCYDSEFKLTCNHMDSKIGLLEATFTPHCESSDGNNKCLFYDEDSIMKIISQSMGNKLEHEEEQAARKLLDALRNARQRELEKEENEARTSEYRSSDEFLNSTDSSYDLSTLTEQAENGTIDYGTTLRSDKKVLRDSLEKLISIYLTKLREENIEYEMDDNHIRERRELSKRVNRRKKLIPGKCKQLKRNIKTLDRDEIDKALRNYTTSEFNIRKLLNYRCSGKNHCSFIFSTDHPYALFWEAGIVHIKYICMDDFRVNKYCGELLNIGNEVWSEDDNAESIDSGEQLGEPIAQARIHSDQSFHQFTNLKIIKAEKDETNRTSLPRASNKNQQMKLLTFKPVSEKSKSKVYSQDFTKLKVLPKVIDEPDPDIEKMKKEEYEFKKDNEQITPVDSGFEMNEIDSTLPTISGPFAKVPTTSNESAPTIEIPFTINTGQSTNEIHNFNFTSSQLPASTTTSITTEEHDIVIVERKDLEKTASADVPKQDVYTSAISESDDSLDKAKFESLPRGGGVLEPFHNDTYYSSYEDEDFEEVSTKRPINYKSFQHALPSSTLLHGFIVNPGYPSYYIGTSDCKWKINMADDHRMTLTILDLHLRVDEFCKDSLEILDAGEKKSLYRGCLELTRPIQLQSISNHIEIILRTKSRSLYPKRGFLIHYKAVGCLLPITPSNVNVTFKSENLAKFVCHHDHVFPDTSDIERVLSCNETSWNNSLPNCVEVEQIRGSGLVLLGEHLRKENKMSSDSDMFNDILVPVFIISLLFILNAVAFAVILRYRKIRSRRHELEFDQELANL